MKCSESFVPHIWKNCLTFSKCIVQHSKCIFLKMCCFSNGMDCISHDSIECCFRMWKGLAWSSSMVKLACNLVIAFEWAFLSIMNVNFAAKDNSAFCDEHGLAFWMFLCLGPKKICCFQFHAWEAQEKLGANFCFCTTFHKLHFAFLAITKTFLIGNTLHKQHCNFLIVMSLFEMMWKCNDWCYQLKHFRSNALLECFLTNDCQFLKQKQI